ncbi:MAG: T9SS type A sorting domain-containing protein, partial [Bacteroidota bacterium]|nr:T9SS type A sorting domain-containing protein [Bacteroidota bacterium]MDX5430424.1 T9SS type A sorting domain-containing protein [Bacteroidota bacterium]MDX5469183.1 T9SS type A sorting domain-containing protein [Bacteroidota bacterium]
NLGLQSNIEKLKVYPNPARTYLMIESEHAALPNIIYLVHMDGRIEEYKTNTLSSHEIRIEHLKPGIYILKIGEARLPFVVKD